jgi:hypothetical protein
MKTQSKWDHVDFGTKPTTLDIQRISVTINPDIMIKDYAQAYLRECLRVNPVKFEALKASLTFDAIYEYFCTILKIRIDSCSLNGSEHWRQAKTLYIPEFLQFAISQVGVVIDQTRGLEFVPVMDYDYDIHKAIQMSTIISAFTADGLVAFKDAFPRDSEGDAEVMSFNVVKEYIYSISSKATPIASYVAAFLGLKIKETRDFGQLYRVRYDDIKFITEMLINERGIYD